MYIYIYIYIYIYVYRISADAAACTNERDMLNEEFRVAEIHGAATGEEKADLEELKGALLAEQEVLK
jgi:hypothetical protein